MKKKYGPLGLKLPILNLKDPDYCEHGCPVCTRARKGNRLAKLLQALEMKLSAGGCPWGRAREQKYGVKPHEPIPDEGGPADDDPHE